MAEEAVALDKTVVVEVTPHVARHLLQVAVTVLEGFKEEAVVVGLVAVAVQAAALVGLAS